MPSWQVMVARFPYGGSEDHRLCSWLIATVGKMKQDRRISAVHHIEINDTPITMSRNRAVKAAQTAGADYLLMVDSDMSPDLPLPGSKPFWDTSWDFVLEYGRPCVVAAPYCGPPPCENVYVFRWANTESDSANPNFSLEQFPREEAAKMLGIQEVAALPTGILLLDLRALQAISPPYFDYEYKDPPFNTEKSTTEDVYFTRNLSLAGVPQFCNWDAWAGHVKSKVVGKPTPLTVDVVRDDLAKAILAGHHSRERILEVEFLNRNKTHGLG
jgi:hypothetical protein